MKKLYTLSFTLLAIASSFAQHVPFTGTGTLNANGWTQHSGTTPGQLMILETASDNGNSLSFPGLAASTGNRTSVVAGNSEDVNYPTSAAILTTAYYSALIKPVDNVGMQPNTSVSGDYFLALGGTAGASLTSLPARVYIRQGVTPNTVNLGVLNNSGGPATPAFLSDDFAVGVTYFVVVKYDLALNTASLFLNPIAGGAEPTASSTNATGTSIAPAAGIASIAIRQGGNATTGTGNVEIDEIRVGETWASVTPATLSVKQNSIAGLKVYPNPVTNGTLFISTDNNTTKSVAVYDVLGKQVINTIATSSVNVSSLKSGVYMVKITEDGKTATRKIVIQ